MPLRNKHPFLLSSTASIHLLVQDFLEKYLAGISFSQKGEIILEFDRSHKSKQPDKLNEPLTPLISSISVVELILETLIICPY